MPEPTSPSADDVLLGELTARRAALEAESERLLPSIGNSEVRTRIAVIDAEVAALGRSIGVTQARLREARLITRNNNILELEPRLQAIQRRIRQTMAALQRDRHEEQRLLAEVEGMRRV